MPSVDSILTSSPIRSLLSARRATVATLSVAALSSLLALAGCGPGGGMSSSSVSAGFGSGAAVSASKKADFMAIREYTSYSGSETTSYKERFVHADDGRVHVQALELNHVLPQNMTPEEYQQFQALQNKMNLGGGRFIATVRDFAIQDVYRFAQNYNASLISTTSVVAHRPCVLTEVNPKSSDRPHYLVWADGENFVTLKYREYLPNGALAAEMETLEVDFAYNAKQEAFPDLPITKPVDVASAQWSSLVNFKTFEPAYLPSGFVLDSIKLGGIATFPTLVSTYDDGIQQINLFQYAEQGTPEVEPANYPDNAPLHIRGTVIGGFVDSWFVVDATMLHIKGKVDSEEVKSMIESLNPVGP